MLRQALLTTAFLIATSLSAQTWQPAGGDALPTGAVMYFAVQTCPAGWLEANGGPVSQSAYPKLYAAVGGQLPDIRGEFIRGWDHGRGVDPGRVFGSYQADEIKSHSHNLGAAAAQVGSVPVAAGGGSSTQSSATGGTETRPRNMALLVCIKT